MTEYIETGDEEALTINGAWSQDEDERKAEFARRFIESCVLRYKIFMDTCSLLDPYANAFWANTVPFLERYGAHIVVPARCVEEVDRQTTNKTDTDLAARAQAVHEKLYTLVMRRLVQVRGEHNDGFADSVFLSVGAKYRTIYDMMLITQDRILAREFEALRESQAVRTTRSIIARRINRFGFLSPFRDPVMDEADSAVMQEGDEQDEAMESDSQMDDEQLPLMGDELLQPSIGQSGAETTDGQGLTDTLTAEGQ